LANLHYLHVWLEFECHKLPLVVFEQFRPVVQLVWLQLWVISWLGVFHIVYDRFLAIQMYTVHAAAIASRFERFFSAICTVYI
jgi:hypothetical protein